MGPHCSLNIGGGIFKVIEGNQFCISRKAISLGLMPSVYKIIKTELTEW